MPATGPFRTQNDLIIRVLDILGVLSVGQSIDPEDYAKVANNLDSWVRKLAADEIVYVADTNNIPSLWFEDVAAIIAGLVAPSFGISGQDLADLVGNGLGGNPSGAQPGSGTAAKSLKLMLRARPTYEVLRIEYF
jgi:hypothetical protein